MKFYVDGVPDGTSSSNGATSANSIALRIGGSNGAAWWDGLIDDVAIFSGTLSGDKIASLMYKQIDPEEENLIGYWTFNDHQGRVAYDRSRFGNHGKLVGGVDYFASETKPVHIKPFDVMVTVSK
jgi:hypothetical protein